MIKEVKSYNDPKKYGCSQTVIEVLNELNHKESIFLVKGKADGPKEILDRGDAILVLEEILKRIEAKK